MTENSKLQSSFKSEIDLGNYKIEDVCCCGCRGVFCGGKTTRMLNGKPILLCAFKQETRELLQRK